MRFPGFIGPSYTLQSVNVDAQRCVNLVPEINEVGKGKEGEVVHLAGSPGTKTVIQVGTGPIRCLHVTPSGIILAVSNNAVYKITYNSNTDAWSSSLLGTMNIKNSIIRATSSVGAQDMVSSQPFTEELVVFVGGDQEYLFRRYLNSGTITETFSSFSSASYKGSFVLEPFDNALGGSHVALVDGYRIYNKLNSGKFFVSDLDSPGVDPLSFFTAEGDPDNLLAVIANYRDVWLFGERTTEIWQSSGDVNAPFVRAASGFIEQGCFARFSPATIQGQVVWLGRNQEGRGVVYMSQGYQPKRISTHAVEFAINSYANPENAVAYTYQEGGHFFYVLNFAEATWVYDIATGLWHERSKIDQGVLKRHRGQTYAFAPNIKGGIHLLGDCENGKIYQLSTSLFTDDDDEIVRIRTAPHISAQGKRLRHGAIELDMETGVGLDGTGQGTDPQCILDWSDDGGHSWSNEHWASIGKIGQKRQRAIWRRLGMSRDRVYRVKITDKTKVVLIGANLQVEGG